MSADPAVRRAAPDEGAAVGSLWLCLLEEQAALDPRFAPADDALARWHADWDERARSDARRIFVAGAPGAPVGFVTAVRWWPAPVYAGEGEVYLDELYVQPEHRGRGVGSALVAAVRAWAEATGAARLRLGLLAANDVGRRFWAGRGAEVFTETYTIALTLPPDASVKDRRIGF